VTRAAPTRSPRSPRPPPPPRAPRPPRGALGSAREPWATAPRGLGLADDEVRPCDRAANRVQRPRRVERLGGRGGVDDVPRPRGVPRLDREEAEPRRDER